MTKKNKNVKKLVIFARNGAAIENAPAAIQDIKSRMGNVLKKMLKPAIMNKAMWTKEIRLMEEILLIRVIQPMAGMRQMEAIQLTEAIQLMRAIRLMESKIPLEREKYQTTATKPRTESAPNAGTDTGLTQPTSAIR